MNSRALRITSAHLPRPRRRFRVPSLSTVCAALSLCAGSAGAIVAETVGVTLSAESDGPAVIQVDSSSYREGLFTGVLLAGGAFGTYAAKTRGRRRESKE